MQLRFHITKKLNVYILPIYRKICSGLRFCKRDWVLYHSDGSTDSAY